MSYYNQYLYAIASAAVLTYIAHHTGSSDVGVAFLAFLAHLLHVPVTKAMGDDTKQEN